MQPISYFAVQRASTCYLGWAKIAWFFQWRLYMLTLSYKLSRSLPELVHVFTHRAAFVLSVLLGLCIPITTSGTAICAVLLLALFVFGGEYKEKFELIHHPIVWPTLIVIGVMGLSCFYGPATYHERISALTKLYKLLLPWIILYYISPNQQRLLIFAVFFSIFINVVAIYLNHFVLTDHIIAFSGGNHTAPRSTIFTGLMFSCAAFIYFSMASFVTRKPVQYGLIILGLFTIVAELGLNNSRTGYVIELTIIVALFISRYRMKGLFLGLTACILVVVGFYHASPTFQSRTTQAVHVVHGYMEGNDNRTSSAARLSFYFTTFQVFKQHPGKLLTGCGAGSIVYSSEQARQKTLEQQPQLKNYVTHSSFTNPHNQYIWFLMQSGLLGLGAFLVLLVVYFRAAQELSHPLQRNNALILLLAFASGSLFNSWMSDLGPSMFFCYLIPVFFIGLNTRLKNKT